MPDASKNQPKPDPKQQKPEGPPPNLPTSSPPPSAPIELPAAGAPPSPSPALEAGAEGEASMISNMFVIAGLIVLGVVALWGLLHLASLSKSWFSSALSSRAAHPSIEVKVPGSAASGAPVEISWSYSPSDSGSYSLLYACDSRFRFGAAPPKPPGIVPCGMAFTLPPEASQASSVSLVPLLSGDSSLSVRLSILYIPAGTSTPEAEGSATLQVSPGASVVRAAPAPAAAAPAAAAPASNSGSSARSGPADLYVHIISVGVVDPATGDFVNRAPGPGDTVAVQFDIGNQGGSPTGTWYFDAHLPTSQEYTYHSPAQASLSPQGHVVNTLRFSQVAPQGGLFTVVADPSGTVQESDKSNNEDSRMVY